jgi:hypothetical protein
MRFLKNRLLARRAKQLASRVFRPRHSPNYRDARRIGIMFEASGPSSWDWLRRVRELLVREGKQVDLLAFFPRQPKELPDDGTRFFTSSQISLTGDIRSEQAREFAQQEFDYLYCIAPDQSPVFDGLLAESRAKCRVGRYISGKDRFYDLMVSVGQRPSDDQLMEELLRISKAMAKP